MNSDSCACMPGHKWSLVEMIYFQGHLPSSMVDRVPASSAGQHPSYFPINKLWTEAFADFMIQQVFFQVALLIFFLISLLQVQMKDFRFSYKFKMACKEDVLKLCPNIKKKYVAPDQTAMSLYKYVIKLQDISR